MSLFDSELSLPGFVDNSGDSRRSPSPILPSDKEDITTATDANAQDLDPHNDARAIVRLMQCWRCSLPLRQPLALSCGNSLCRECLPETYKRENITYPNTPGRSERFNCPFPECGREHSLGDCGLDVTLIKVLDQVSSEITKCRPLTIDSRILLDERLHWRNIIDSCRDDAQTPHSRILVGGRLVATYTMAELGELRYDSELSYHAISPTTDNFQALDNSVLELLREVTRNELDCHVCYAMMLEPLTLGCGHTFCRKCVLRVLDHSQSCPACRRSLTFSPGEVASAHSNKTLSQLLLALCPEQVAARVKQVEAEEAAVSADRQIPLFVCTLAYPRIPTFLHIFEPRYRLMIRRAMETDRKFGMLTYNAHGEPQGELGSVQFLQYGTLLEIINMQLLSDGRSLIETIGVSRFCVREHDMCDGYLTGRVDRIDDISFEEEEQQEADAVSAAQPTSEGDDPTPLASLSTSELLNISISFIQRMRLASAPWLSDRIRHAYGPMPDDPAIFPYWFASVLPLDDGEKYKLLPATSVRQRLLICAEWVRSAEGTRWLARLRCLWPGSHPDPASSADSPSSDSSEPSWPSSQEDL